jgi:hypothetical protein
MVVAPGWAALMVAVRVPVPPAVMGSDGGSSRERVGGGTVPYRVRSRKLPGTLVRRTCKVLLAWRITVRSKPATCWEKSEGPATWVPLSVMVALLTRLVPSGFPFWT